MTEEKAVVVRTVEDMPIVRNETTDSIIEGIQSRIQAPSGDKIRVTQFKKFRLPDGEETDGPLEGVIVDFVSSNVFYKDSFRKDSMGSPDCFAINPQPALLVPSARSPDRQADSCGVCPNNQFGSGPGGRGKACKNTRVVAFMPLTSTADSAPSVLTVSPTAVKGFDDYVRGLASKKVAPIQVVTAVGFDKKFDYPSLKFVGVRPLDSAEFDIFASKLDEARARLLVEPDITKAEETKPTPRGRR